MNSTGANWSLVMLIQSLMKKNILKTVRNYKKNFNAKKSLLGVFALLVVFTVVAQMGGGALTNTAFAVGAVTLFENGFENAGGFNTPTTWTSVDSKWGVDSGPANEAHGGTKKAKVEGNTGDTPDSLSKSISTEGYENITLSYWYKVNKAIESDDHVYVEWSTDGSTWNQATDLTGLAISASWVKNSHILTSGANDNAGFRFRFRADLDAGNDLVWFDDVKLEGSEIVVVPPPTENTAELCSDGQDNDGDTLTDLADPDCAAFVPEPEPQPELFENTEVLLQEKVNKRANKFSKAN